MSILEKYSAALKNKDEAAMNELLHEDFKFTMHKSGNVLTKSDVIKWAMSGDINQDKVRIVYENDEVGIHHAFVTFNDGNVEAVMAVYKYDNGKIVSLETGATPMPNNYIYLARFHLDINESATLFILGIAVFLGVTSNSFAKSAEGFTLLVPSIITAITIVLCMYALSLVMKNIPMGITYASFAGLTIIATVVVGIIRFNQVPNLYSLIGLAFIVIGVLMVNLLGNN